MVSAVIHQGDCRVILPTMPKRSVDTVITDPPYGLEFMGAGWDQQVPGVDFWKAIRRVTKPGGTLLAFGGTRTYHRLACAIEDAGWEIRDCIMWIYGTGFPKSQNISKEMDKRAGVVSKKLATGDVRNRGKVGGDDEAAAIVGSGIQNRCAICGKRFYSANSCQCPKDDPVTELAKLWNGWGTALKPAWEPIIVAQRPLIGTYITNAKKYGVAGLNIDGCRVEVTDSSYAKNCSGDRGHADNRSRNMDFNMGSGKANQLGRWPANIIHDGSDEVRECFPDAPGQRGHLKAKSTTTQSKDGIFGGTRPALNHPARAEDDQNAARFFYCAKATTKDRGKGNTHPTVKPKALMRYLCDLTKTPAGGVILDPFAGSGTTGVAAVARGRDFIGIELEEKHVEIARDRIERALKRRERKLAEEAPKKRKFVAS